MPGSGTHSIAGNVSGAVLFTVRGADELSRRLRDLGPKLNERYVKRIMRSAGQEVVRAAKANVTAIDSGLLRESLGLVVRVNRRTGRVLVVVGPRGDAQFTMVDSRTGKLVKRPTKYAHLVEFGTQPHQIIRRGISKRTGRPWVQVIQHPGTPARPFMRPAFDVARGSVQARIQRDIEKGLQRIARESQS